MARSVTAASMMTRFEQMAGIENDTHLSTSEKWLILSSAIAETWDTILSAGLGQEYVKSVTFSTTAGTSEYPFGTIVSAGDFYKISSVLVNEGNGMFRPIHRVAPAERHAYRAPDAVVAMKLYYTPVAPVWTGTGDAAFDGINGYEEHALVTACITAKAKKEDDSSVFRGRKRELEGRIKAMVNKNLAEPNRVVRRRSAYRDDQYLPWRQNVSAYDIRGVNLELCYRYGVAP